MLVAAWIVRRTCVTATAYYRTIFQEPAADIREIVRDFNNYPGWIDGSGESRIEDGKSGDAVGAIRSVLYQDRHIRHASRRGATN